jgi:hypothetical protein
MQVYLSESSHRRTTSSLNNISVMTIKMWPNRQDYIYFLLYRSLTCIRGPSTYIMYTFPRLSVVIVLLNTLFVTESTFTHVIMNT